MSPEAAGRDAVSSHRHRRQRPEKPVIVAVIRAYHRHGFETWGFSLLVLLGWSRVMVTLVQLLQHGRPSFNSRASAPSIAGDALGDICSLAFIGVAALITFRGIRKYQPGNLAGIMIVLAPWLLIELSGVLNGLMPSAASLAYPLAATAVWLQPPARRVLAVFGGLTLFTVGGSIILALVLPDVGMLTGGAAGFKPGLLGGLLAGPYLHSNVLGIAVVLGMPFALLMSNVWWRWGGIAMLVLALWWTGSRSSLAAGAVVIAFHLVMNRFRAKLWIAHVTAGLGALAVLALPIVTTDPEAFTRRGRIWQSLLALWAERPLTGYGSGFFRSWPGLADLLGGHFNHAHNLMVQVLVIGGIAAASCYAFMLFLAWRRSVALHRAGTTAAIVFIVAALFVSTLEASHAATSLAGYAMWMPILLIVKLGAPNVIGAPRTAQEAVSVPPAVEAAGTGHDTTVVLPRVRQQTGDVVPPARPQRDVHSGADAVTQIIPAVRQDVAPVADSDAVTQLIPRWLPTQAERVAEPESGLRDAEAAWRSPR